MLAELEPVGTMESILAARIVSLTWRLQRAERMQNEMAEWSRPGRSNVLYAAVLRAVATHRVNDRPGRIEPRAVKRRLKKLVYLNDPRPIAKARLLKGA